MNLHHELITFPTYLDRLIDDPNRSIYVDLLEHILDVFGEHAHAPVRNAHAHAGRTIGTVNQVAWQSQAHRKLAQRIVRTGRDDPLQRAPVGRMLFAYRFGREPCRIPDL